jgi:PleD family two-component response regulator
MLLKMPCSGMTGPIQVMGGAGMIYSLGQQVLLGNQSTASIVEAGRQLGLYRLVQNEAPPIERLAWVFSYVLIVEDQDDDALMLLRVLQCAGYDLTFDRVDTAKALEAALDRQTWDIIIADYTLPKFNGLAALVHVKERGLDLPFIIVSGTSGEDIAVAAMKAGAHDYIMKNNLARLIPAVERELREVEVRQARKRAEETLQENYQIMHAVFEGSDTIFVRIYKDDM